MPPPERGLGSASFPLWLLYGLLLGGFIPAMFGLRFFWTLIGMLLGCGVVFLIDRWLKRQDVGHERK